MNLLCNRRFLLRALCLLGAVLALVGCKGLPTQSEKNAREQVASVAAGYRPQNHKPELPLLSTNSTLKDYLQYAMLNQPTVESAYYDWAGSIERITTARSLPDPVLTFQMDIENIVTSIMPGLVMNFPGAGKLRAGAEVASAESRSRYFTFQSAILQNAYEVKRAYYQLHFLNERLEVNGRNLRILSDLERLARAQNEVGKVTLQDVLRAQLEQDRLRNEIANLEDSRASMLAQFSAALGLKPGAPAPPLPQRFESTPLDLTADQVLSAALTNNTRLKSLAAEVRQAEASIHLAEKNRMPDTSLGLMADAKTSPALYRPLATISLPLWRDKIAAQIAEAQAARRSASARLTSEQIALAVSVAEKTYVYRASSRNLALLHDQILPKAHESLEVARIGYLSGQIDFFNLSDTERTLLGYELERVESSLQRELALAELSLIVQGMPPADSSTASAGLEAPSGKAPASAKPAGGM
jgi:outer membrane protein, heavy metal efflux system